MDMTECKIHNGSHTVAMFKPDDRVAYIEFDGSKEYGRVSNLLNKEEERVELCR